MPTFSQAAALKRDSVPEQALARFREVESIALSAVTLRKIPAVLAQPAFGKFVSESRRAGFLHLLCARHSFFTPSERIADCRDAKDNKYLELAVECGA